MSRFASFRRLRCVSYVKPSACSRAGHFGRNREHREAGDMSPVSDGPPTTMPEVHSTSASGRKWPTEIAAVLQSVSDVALLYNVYEID